jgi:membrane-associated phospholipid phosphatase
MSLTGGLKAPVADRAASWLRWGFGNAVQACARLVRPPLVHAKPAWRASSLILAGGVAALACIVLAMFFVDALTVEAVKSLPAWASITFGQLTDFGKSSWFLVPIGLLLVLVAAIASPALAHPSQLVLASVAVRLEFLFVAIAAPSVFTTIIKRLIGRARPMVSGQQTDPFLYEPFVWRPDYASLPSGHVTTAFAAAIAIGLLWPRLRPVLWAYALIIAVSRVALFAHHPSDVVAGAFVGVVGALLVRDWFAQRRLGFAMGPDGTVRALPGPSRARIKRVARGLIAP